MGLVDWFLRHCVPHKVNLAVQKAGKEDVYCDRVRIPECHRGRIKEGRICKIEVNGKSTLCANRGTEDEKKQVIGLDETTRVKLNIKLGQEYDFAIREVTLVGQFWWAWNASQSASRLAARLGILSLVLGVFGFLLGIKSTFF